MVFACNSRFRPWVKRATGSHQSVGDGGTLSAAAPAGGAQGHRLRRNTLKVEAMLVQARKIALRLFCTVDSALKLLHKLGVRRIVLDRLDRLEHWHPEQAALDRRSRPDRAQALTRVLPWLMRNGEASARQSWLSGPDELRRLAHNSSP